MRCAIPFECSLYSIYAQDTHFAEVAIKHSSLAKTKGLSKDLEMTILEMRVWKLSLQKWKLRNWKFGMALLGHCKAKLSRLYKIVNELTDYPDAPLLPKIYCYNWLI